MCVQVEVQAATEQTQHHSRQHAQLLTAQLQAAQSAASLGERLPVPPPGQAGAADVLQEEKWRHAVGSMLRSTLDTFAADQTVRFIVASNTLLGFRLFLLKP